MVRLSAHGTSTFSKINGLRAFCAIYVCCHHVSQMIPLGNVARVLLSFGQEAVIIFFLLSGYVIWISEVERRHRFSTGRYYARRFLRIYPTLLVSLAITYLVASIFSTSTRTDLGTLLGNLAGWQDSIGLKPGVFVGPFGGNAPLWSLSYELVFYAIFPAALKLHRILGNGLNHFIGIWSLLSMCAFGIEPNHFTLMLSYFIIWWTGTALARYKQLNTDTKPIYVLASYMLAVGLLATTTCNHFHFSSLGVWPLLGLRHFSSAAFFSLAAVFATRAWSRWSLGPKTSKFLDGLANSSYGIYLFHYPILILTGAYKNPFHLLIGAVALGIFSHVFDAKLSALVRRKCSGFSHRRSQKNLVAE